MAEYYDYLYQRTMSKQHREHSEYTGAVRIECLRRHPFAYSLVERARNMTRATLSEEDKAYPQIKAQLFERHLCTLLQESVPAFAKEMKPCTTFERFKVPSNTRGTIQEYLRAHNIPLSLLLQENDVTLQQLINHFPQHKPHLSFSEKPIAYEIDTFIDHPFISDLSLDTFARLASSTVKSTYSPLMWARSPTDSFKKNDNSDEQTNWADLDLEWPRGRR